MQEGLRRRACRAPTAGTHAVGVLLSGPTERWLLCSTPVATCGREKQGHRQQARHRSVRVKVASQPRRPRMRRNTEHQRKGGRFADPKNICQRPKPPQLPTTPEVEPAANTSYLSRVWLDLCIIGVCRLGTSLAHPSSWYTHIQAAGESSFRPRTRSLMAALVVDEAGAEPPVLPEDPPSPTWWPLEESLAARGRLLPIYTFASQFAGEHESVLFNGDGNDDQNREAPSPEQVADVDFLRGLNLRGLEAGGEATAPIRRFMVSPAAAATGGGKKSRYDEDNPPTPATLVADLKASANFKSAITDMDDDGSGAPLPYLGYMVFACADEVHEDDEKQYIFATSEDLAEAIAEAESEVVDPAADEGDMGAGAYHENTLQSRAQLASLKQYVLKQRVFYVLIHTDRRRDVKLADQDKSSDVLLLALGVSPATGNLVGVIAIQTCHNLCD